MLVEVWFMNDDKFLDLSWAGYRDESLPIKRNRADYHRVYVESMPTNFRHMEVCESLWARCQNLEKPWHSTERSACVGDIIVIGDVAYITVSIGFKPAIFT